MKKSGRGKAAAMLLAGALAVACAVPAGAEDTPANKQLQFNTDGNFTILILSDIHETDQPYEDSLDHINEALQTAKPDLVVLLGDQIGAWDEANDRLPHEQCVERVRSAIDQIMQPIVRYGVPFALVYGNHDHEANVTREEQMAMYQQYPGCLAVDEGPSLPRCGTYNLTVKDSRGLADVLNLYFIDSGSSTTEEERAAGLPAGYQAVTKEQITWYEAKSNELRQQNGGKPMPSLLFQHIVVPEVYNLFEEVHWYTPGATRGQEDTWKKRFFKIADPQAVTGDIKEGPCPPNYNNGEFDSWKKQGDVVGAFFGHDHKNDFSGQLDGICLTATRSAGTRAYGGSRSRGARIVTLHEDDLTRFETQSLHMVDRRVYRKNTLTVVGSTAAGIVGAGVLTAGVVFLVRRKKAKKAAQSNV